MPEKKENKENYQNKCWQRLWKYLFKADSKCMRKLKWYLARGWRIVGQDNRWGQHIMIARDKDSVAKPFCLNDSTFNR